MSKHAWQKQTSIEKLEIINCPGFDPIKHFHRDPTGVYVLIRCDHSTKTIEVAICDKKHVIIKVFRGNQSQQLYYTVFQYEKKHQLNWFSRKDHIAYLGKELKKAEIALQTQGDYIQE